MAERNNIHGMAALIGVSVLSRSSGNKLGQIDDLVIDPIRGTLLGLMVQTPDGSKQVLDYLDISSFGQDAVMATNDNSVRALEGNQLAQQPLGRQNLTGATIITEGGKLLGVVANVFVHLAPPPLVIYEVRESLLDKLLGRELFIPASFGLALSDRAERIIVPDDTVANAANSLDVLANHLFGSQTSPGVTVRSRRVSDEETLVRGDG